MTEPIRFYHRNAIREIKDAPVTRTVLQYLREDAHCTGTKEGCAEGDCGACTVVIGERNAAGGVDFKAVNACIQFLPTLDGKALFTVEDLRQPDGSLHPVQEAMVECHGSQCGFCTPGFVMSMWSLYEKHGHEHSCANRTVPSRKRSATRCPATCAAAPATGRSSMRPCACSKRLRRKRRSNVDALAADARHARAQGHVPLRARRPAVRRAAHGRRAREAQGSRARRAHSRRLHRHRPVGHQADARAGQHRLCRADRRIAEARNQRRMDRNRRRRLARRGLCGDREALSGTRPKCGSASPRCRSATPARWAATSPTARRSATRCRADRARRARDRARRRDRARDAARRPLPRVQKKDMAEQSSSSG